jgi:outer membrane protein assembly factor BamB
VIWTFASGELSGLLSQPIVHGNVVVITSLDGELRAIDRTSGKLAWTVPDLPTEIAPVLIDSFLGIATTDGRLQLLDLGNRQKGSAKLAEPVNAMLANGSTLIAVGEHGLITAYAVPMLDVLWHRRLPDLNSPMATLAGSKVVLANDQGSVQALELANGSPSWTRQLAPDTLGAPVMTGRDIMVASPSKLYRLDIATGKDLAPIDRPDQDWSGPPVVIGERLVAPLRDGPLQVIDRQSGKALYRIESTKRSRLHAVGRSLFVDTAEHTLLVFHELR